MRTTPPRRRGPGTGARGFASRLGGRLLIGRMERAPLTTADILELGPRPGHRAKRSVCIPFSAHHIPVSAGRPRSSRSLAHPRYRGNRLPAPPAAAELARRCRPGRALRPGEAGTRAKPGRGAGAVPLEKRTPSSRSPDAVSLYLLIGELLLLVDRLLVLHRSGPSRRARGRRRTASGTAAQSDFPAAAPGDGSRGGTRRAAPRGLSRAPQRPSWEGPLTASLLGPRPCFSPGGPSAAPAQGAARWPTPALGKDARVGTTSLRHVSFW